MICKISDQGLFEIGFPRVYPPLSPLSPLALTPTSSRKAMKRFSAFTHFPVTPIADWFWTLALIAPSVGRMVSGSSLASFFGGGMRVAVPGRFLCPVAALLLVVFCAASAQAGANPRLRVGDKGAVMLDGKPFSGVGVNFYSAFERTLENPADTGSEDGFRELARLGIPFARVDFSGHWPGKAALFFNDREEFFRRLDGVVASAEKHGVGLIPCIFWTTFAFPDLAGEHLDQLAVNNSVTREKMREFATAVIERYKSSPAIWAWEFGNEWNLAVDLPNATDWLPPTHTALGNPSTRDPQRDILTTDTILPAMEEFGQIVRRLDPGRPISTGHAMSRPAQWHLDQWRKGVLSAEKAWTTDSPDQAAEIALRQCPDAYDLLSVHVYGDDPDRLPVFAEVAADNGKALFVGEFGTTPEDDAAFAPMLEEVKQAPLSAVWVYDRANDEYSMTGGNGRAWMLDLLKGRHE